VKTLHSALGHISTGGVQGKKGGEREDEMKVLLAKLMVLQKRDEPTKGYRTVNGSDAWSRQLFIPKEVAAGARSAPKKPRINHR